MPPGDSGHWTFASGPGRARACGLAGDGTAFRGTLVGQSGLGGFPGNLTAFLGGPLVGLLLGLAGQRLGGRGSVTFALQRLGDGLRPPWVGLVRVSALATGELGAPPGAGGSLTL